ncbi:hypothetical protein GJAV_G00192970 [Gymnothorax javanicus]|nr:hypothetical protein GJAV_G00192970 [Gymnothorax javanicus]
MVQRKTGASCYQADFSSETRDTYSILSADQSHTGSYSCRGELKMRATVHSMTSKSVPLRVQGERPKPTITQNPLTGQLYIGEIVTLSCGFGGDSASWKYLWYRDTMEAALPNTDRSGVSYTIRSAALDLSGEYRCRAARGTKPFYSDYSDPLTLQISDLPRANLSVQSGWTAVFPTETVTLKCVIEDSSTDWIYKWYRGRQELPVGEADFSSETGDTYTILSADQSHTGLYSCRGELKRRAVQSTVSNTVKLNILPVPKANLTVQTGWTEIFPRETVTLKCVIEDSSTDWIYKWYRGGEELAVEEADFSSETGETYTILSAEQSHSGLYRCRGELTMRPTVHSLDSSFVTLSVQAQLQAVLALNVGWVEIFTIIMQGSLRMRCELQGSSANWNYIWYRNRTKISLNHTGQSHTVGFWDSFSHEEYACQGNRTDGRYCSLISDGFTPANTRPYVILGLSGCVIIFITMVVLAVKCYKKRKIAGENQVDGGEFYSRVNADYIRTDRGLLNQAVYEEINPTTETEGSEVAAGQLNFYSVVQLKPLNQGSEAATGQLSFYSAVQLKPQNQGELSTE